MDYSLPIIFAATALGMSHALDADHVLAISNLNQRRPGLARTSRFCIRWCLGHGITLMSLGLLIYGIGLGVPENLGSFAEILVGLMLVVTGGWLLLHRHAPVTGETSGETAYRHTPLLIGILHGLAGSAPVMALIPAAGAQSASDALLYLLFFSLGIVCSMLIFALLFSHTLGWMEHRHQRLLTLTRTLLAGSALSIGLYLVLENWS